MRLGEQSVTGKGTFVRHWGTLATHLVRLGETSITFKETFARYWSTFARHLMRLGDKFLKISFVTLQSVVRNPVSR